MNKKQVKSAEALRLHNATIINNDKVAERLLSSKYASERFGHSHKAVKAKIEELGWHLPKEDGAYLMSIDELFLLWTELGFKNLPQKNRKPLNFGV